MTEGRLYAPAGSPTRPLAETLAWVWRLGPVLDAPAPLAVGFGGLGDERELRSLVSARALAGSVVLAGDEAEAEPAAVTRRRFADGVARLPTGPVAGRHALLAGPGRPTARSRLGVHALREERHLVLGAQAGDWGAMAGALVADQVGRFLVDVLDRPLVAMPALGCLRLDDAPGTAELQLAGAALDDAAAGRRVQAIVADVERARAVLVVAVAARALSGERFVALDEVWPSAVGALAEAVGAGILEAACHGLTHLDEAALATGVAEPREFARLDEAEAGRRLDAAVAWMERALGPPQSFIAPAWGYSAGTLRAAAQRGLLTWMAPAPGPILRNGHLHETLHDGLPGLSGLGYGALATLARWGVPPTVVFHGRLLDDRPARLRAARQALTLARLWWRRDLARIAGLPGIRWVGASELADRLAAHESIEVDGDVVAIPDGVQAHVLRPPRA